MITIEPMFVLSAILLYLGTRSLLDKDWAWRQTEFSDWENGTKTERTPAWERRMRLNSWIEIAVGIVFALIGLS